MRKFLDIVAKLNETVSRNRTPESYAWLQQAYARDDVDELYLHGSDHVFDHFVDPKIDYGRLIFATKLVEQYEHRDVARVGLQAEHYGRNHYLIKIHPQKRFNPYKSDPVAQEIFAAAVADTWDAENKIKYGRFDYQDAHLVIPPAVAAGYDFFRIYEMAAQGSSYGSAFANMIEIVDRHIP
jgi:hypothetical protein